MDRWYWYDWCEKNIGNLTEEKEIPISEYVCYFASYNVGEIFQSFCRTYYWGNGVDCIAGAHTSEGKLTGVVIDICYGFDEEEHGLYHREILNKQKSLDFLRQLRDQYAAEHPLKSTLKYMALEKDYRNCLDIINSAGSLFK